MTELLPRGKPRMKANVSVMCMLLHVSQGVLVKTPWLAGALQSSKDGRHLTTRRGSINLSMEPTDQHRVQQWPQHTPVTAYQ